MRFYLNQQELRKQRYVARFSMRCWNAVLMAEKKQNVNHYFFQWLRSSTPEEEIYQNLIDLETGKTTLKELNSKLTVSRIDTFFLSSTVADR